MKGDLVCHARLTLAEIKSELLKRKGEIITRIESFSSLQGNVSSYITSEIKKLDTDVVQIDKEILKIHLLMTDLSQQAVDYIRNYALSKGVVKNTQEFSVKYPTDISSQRFGSLHFKINKQVGPRKCERNHGEYLPKASIRLMNTNRLLVLAILAVPIALLFYDLFTDKVFKSLEHSLNLLD